MFSNVVFRRNRKITKQARVNELHQDGESHHEEFRRREDMPVPEMRLKIAFKMTTPLHAILREVKLMNLLHRAHRLMVTRCSSLGMEPPRYPAMILTPVGIPVEP